MQLHSFFFLPTKMGLYKTYERSWLLAAGWHKNLKWIFLLHFLCWCCCCYFLHFHLFYVDFTISMVVLIVIPTLMMGKRIGVWVFILVFFFILFFVFSSIFWIKVFSFDHFSNFFFRLLLIIWSRSLRFSRLLCLSAFISKFLLLFYDFPVA